jgi:hypothetical protein
MTTATAALVPIQPAFTDAETARAGRVSRPDPRGLGAGPAPVHHLVPRPLPGLVRGPPRRHRGLRPRPRSQGRARATVTRRLCTIAGFHRYAVEEELLKHSPAAHVRRPRLDYESHAPSPEDHVLWLGVHAESAHSAARYRVARVGDHEVLAATARPRTGHQQPAGHPAQLITARRLRLAGRAAGMVRLGSRRAAGPARPRTGP